MPIFTDNSSSTRNDKATFKAGKGIDTPSLAWDRQSARWELTDDLASVDAMRDAGVRWLPVEVGEKPDQYHVRLHRSHLLGAYHDTLEKIVAKPFSREITFSGEEELPEKLALMHEDPARDGIDQTTFWREAFKSAVHRGLVHILVEFPETNGDLNRKEEVESRIHPYFKRIDAEQLLSPKYRKRARDGRKELRQIRIKETRVETPEGDPFGEQEVDYILLYNAPPDVSTATPEEIAAADPDALKGTVEEWRFDAKEKLWKLSKEQATFTFPGIPLRTLYFHRAGDLEARPCLWRLAEANLEHWQKKSDRDNLMHVAHVPILFRKGFTAAELKKPLKVGAGHSVGSTQKDATMNWVDAAPAARALEMSKDDIERLEEQMERMGLEPLIRRASSSLATNMMIGDAKEMNLLQAWALLTEGVIGECYQDAGTWVGEEVPDGFSADIYSEFGLSARATENLKVLDSARARGDISHRLYLEDLKRYAVLAEGLDVEEEIERVEEEKAKKVDGMIGMMGGSPPPPEGDDDEPPGEGDPSGGDGDEPTDGNNEE